MSDERPSSARRAPVALTLLKAFGARRSLKVVAEPEFGYAGYIEDARGRRSFFKGAAFDLNPFGAASIARDKAYAAHFLKAAGFRVPEALLISAPAFIDEIRTKNPAVAERLNDAAAALAFAGRVGWPVYVKPNDESEGRGVLRASDAAALTRALATLSRDHDRLLVQQAAAGRDYRILVLDDAVLAAFERRPFAVTGDGVSTLSALIEARTEGFAADGNGRKIRSDDPRILDHLTASGLTPGHVPRAGETVDLLPNANLSSGGSAEEVTAAMSPHFGRIAVAAGRALGLRFYGLDLLCADITAEAGDYAILELNAAPGLSHFHRMGPAEAACVEAIYETLFERLVDTLQAAP
ncbi:RimK-like ATP-grasp domain superfamily [Polymorphum gilvum]|uniref:RimK-like ATP-grasp domain superfamily n=1 Tax=Polymorphum gilvum (strain LMG 25793 / CGMCC 1.9160 / SL003B-26A1) TaxID=991905 RepID=F2IZF6_POLGS|nr:RimK-like ATP-grasp domain superfamily [Polymorphum gilvum]ADZ68579.1 RimK-like ATP-grasp domain superfamily [Polymorphum gilvum SL003B-26A1]